MRLDAGQPLHLVMSEMGAVCVREGLRLVGREDDVEHFYDDLSVGPIRDVDRGASSRAMWWRRVHANKVRPDRKAFDESPLWQRIIADDRKVVLWISSHPTEYLLALRACWFLRRSPSRVFEVRLASSEQPPPAGFGIGMVGPRGVAAAWPTVRAVRDVDRRADRWAELRAKAGDGFREVRRGRIVESPVTAHDAEIVDACSARWMSSIDVVARVFPEIPVGDLVVAWRARELLALGILEGRGPLTLGLNLPSEIRASVTEARRASAKDQRGRDTARRAARERAP